LSCLLFTGYLTGDIGVVDDIAIFGHCIMIAADHAVSFVGFITGFPIFMNVIT
jgi:hypothetical protein